MNKLRLKYIVGAIILIAVLCIAIGYNRYTKAHTFILSGEEQIQAISGTVKVTTPYDTSVIFIDVKTDANFAIPYITAGGSETIALEKGKWYRIEHGEGLTVSPVNVRIE